MKNIIIATLMSLLVTIAWAENTRVIVFEFAVDGPPQNVGKEAASYLTTAVAYLDGFEVVDPAIVNKLCDGEKVESYDVDAATAVKIGRNAATNGADLAAIGKVEKDGSSYKVTVTYVKIFDGSIVSTKSTTGTGIYSISRSIDKIVGLLE
jgi:hypothetical protein